MKPGYANRRRRRMRKRRMVEVVIVAYVGGVPSTLFSDKLGSVNSEW